jgi:hypothetical protein
MQNRRDIDDLGDVLEQHYMARLRNDMLARQARERQAQLAGASGAAAAAADPTQPGSSAARAHSVLDRWLTGEGGDREQAWITSEGYDTDRLEEKLGLSQLRGLHPCQARGLPQLFRGQAWPEDGGRGLRLAMLRLRAC